MNRCAQPAGRFARLNLGRAAALLGACLLQACAGAPPAPAWSVQPLMRGSDSAGQSAASYYALGRYHQQRGEFDQAGAAFDASLALEPGQLDARNAQAALLTTRGHLAPAAALLRQLAAEFPASAQARGNLGYVYYLQGEPRAARTELEAALALDPQYERARANLALLADSAQESGPVPLAAAGATDNVQIVNGNGAAGLGERIKRMLEGYGIEAGDVVNQRRHYQRRTIIEYLPGREAAARAIHGALRGHALLLPARALPGRIGIRVVLGGDLPPHVSATKTTTSNTNQE